MLQQGDQQQGQMAQKPAQPKPQVQGVAPAQPRPQMQNRAWGGQQQRRPADQKPQQFGAQSPAAAYRPQPDAANYGVPAQQQNSYSAAPQQQAQPLSQVSMGFDRRDDVMKGGGAQSAAYRPPNSSPAYNINTGQMEQQQPQAEAQGLAGSGIKSSVAQSEAYRPRGAGPAYNINTGQQEQLQPDAVPAYAQGMFGSSQPGQWGGAQQPMPAESEIGSSYEAIDNPGLRGLDDQQKRLMTYGREATKGY